MAHRQYRLVTKCQEFIIVVDGCIIILFTRFSREILLNETAFNSDNLILHVLKAIASQNTRAIF